MSNRSQILYQQITTSKTVQKICKNCLKENDKKGRTRNRLISALLLATAFTLCPFLWISIIHAVIEADGPAYIFIFICSFFALLIFLAVRHMVLSLIALAQGRPVPSLFFENLILANEEQEKCRSNSQTKDNYKKMYQRVCGKREKIAGIRLANKDVVICEGRNAPCGYKCLRLTDDLNRRRKLYKVPSQAPREYDYFISQSATQLTRDNVINRFCDQQPEAFQRMMQQQHGKTDIRRRRGRRSVSCTSNESCDSDGILYEVLEIPAARHCKDKMTSKIAQYDETIYVEPSSTKLNKCSGDEDLGVKGKPWHWKEGMKGVFHINRAELFWSSPAQSPNEPIEAYHDSMRTTSNPSTGGAATAGSALGKAELSSYETRRPPVIPPKIGTNEPFHRVQTSPAPPKKFALRQLVKKQPCATTSAGFGQSKPDPKIQSEGGESNPLLEPKNSTLEPTNPYEDKDYGSSLIVE